MFNQVQRIVADTYDNGVFAHVQTLGECRNVGETLFTFLMIELSEAEGCDDQREAARRVERAMNQLEELRDRLLMP